VTLSALGIFSAAGAGGGVLSDYELISSTILGSNTSSVAFSSLGTYSSTYKHLQIRYVARSSQAQTYAGITVRFNGDTATNYNNHYLYGNGLDALSGNLAGATGILADQFEVMGASGPANAFGAGVYDILDPYSTTKNKTTRLFGGRGPVSGDAKIMLASGLWRNTASVTSIDLVANDNFVTGSRFSLYGIKG
jgi:hypothetical protein